MYTSCQFSGWIKSIFYCLCDFCKFFFQKWLVLPINEEIMKVDQYMCKYACVSVQVGEGVTTSPMRFTPKGSKYKSNLWNTFLSNYKEIYKRTSNYITLYAIWKTKKLVKRLNQRTRMLFIMRTTLVAKLRYAKMLRLRGWWTKCEFLYFLQLGFLVAMATMAIEFHWENVLIFWCYWFYYVY